MFLKYFSPILLLVVFTLATQGASKASPAFYFKIRVVDKETGRGVPLVRLSTVNHLSLWTDSNGIAAFHEPGLMGIEVFFHVESPGYEYPKDMFDYRGLKLVPAPGGSAEIKLKRLNVAERLYRITGEGIYRDSVLTGTSVPLRQPLLNGKVLGQDTVIATPYRGKIYWFWGDTDRPGYPLGNFGASGAVSEMPGRGGLDPGMGIDFTYFTDKEGFSKAMCAVPDPGLRWIEGVMTLRDEQGRERLLARLANMENLGKAKDWHLMMFDDEKSQFESIQRWESDEPHDSSHPFRATVAGVEYLYLYPNFRVRADLNALQRLDEYEAFTCVSGNGKWRGAQTEIERGAEGQARYIWKKGADRLHSGRLRQLISTGKLQKSESWLQLHDIETGNEIPSGRGSVFWNAFRQRWVMITSGKPGDIWFSEADTPTGPWAYARRIVTHGKYNFYNPTQHPFFDQERGRIIHFEGTYTAAFSEAPAKTPRYDYNQIMYRLKLDDPHLALPAPVYLVKNENGEPGYFMREDIESRNAWSRVERIAFFAMPPGSQQKGLIPVYSDSGQRGGLLTTNRIAGMKPLFLVMPSQASSSQPTADEPASASALATLFEHRDQTGHVSYFAGNPSKGEADDASTGVLGRAWRNPGTVLTLDLDPKPLPEPVAR